MDWREWMASPQYNAGIGGASSTANLNKQNEAIYQQTMAGYGSALNQYQRGIGELNRGWDSLYNQQQGFGQFQLDQVNRQYDAQSAAQQASLMSRGLGNTTVLDSMTRGINYDRANASLNVQDQILQRQNQIRQAQLGYLGDAFQVQAGLANQGNAYAGNYGAQQASIGAQMASQFSQQDEAWRQMQAQQAFQAQLQQGQNNFAQNMQRSGFQQQDYLQSKYGFY